jgi:hypothetical protein
MIVLNVCRNISTIYVRQKLKCMYFFCFRRLTQVSKWNEIIFTETSTLDCIERLVHEKLYNGLCSVLVKMQLDNVRYILHCTKMKENTREVYAFTKIFWQHCSSVIRHASSMVPELVPWYRGKNNAVSYLYCSEQVLFFSVNKQPWQ